MHNVDCMEFMADKPDNYYDLAIVDPPYGIKKSGQRLEKYTGDKAKHNKKHFIDKGWDNATPTKEYFSELMRVSENQIIWGGNYFIRYLYNTKSFFIWDKGQDLDQADAELAWSSLDIPIRRKILNRCILKKQGTIHPTEKPIEIYRWLLTYAKENDKILDTHGGSGSICLACHDMGFDLDWCELDHDYFIAAKERYKKHAEQLQMF